MDIWGGYRGEGPNCRNNVLDYPFDCSTGYHSFGLQTLVWSKLLILTSKKLAFKFSTYIFEYQPLPPMSTLCPPDIFHVMNAPGSSPFFAPGYISSANVYGYIYPLSEFQSSSESVGKRIWPDHSEGPGLKPDWTWSPFSFSLFNVLSTNRMYFQP